MVLRRHTTCLLVEVVDEPAAQDALEGLQCCGDMGGDVDHDAAPCRACFDEDAEVVVDGILVLSIRTSVHHVYVLGIYVPFTLPKASCTHSCLVSFVPVLFGVCRTMYPQ